MKYEYEKPIVEIVMTEVGDVVTDSDVPGEWSDLF